MSTVKNYYAYPHVRRRMLEFLGGDSLENITCRYLTAGDTDNSHHRQPRMVTDLPDLWETGLDIGRSLWDRKSLILDLDIEYAGDSRAVQPLS